jgi:hypothetical protein
MNQQIKQKWLEALRSGKYQQAKDTLRNESRFCCLGVLCDIHAQETGNSWSEDNRYLLNFEALPEDVVRWAELNSDDPEVRDGYNRASALSQLNDWGYSFAEIADLIEASLQ